MSIVEEAIELVRREYSPLIPKFEKLAREQRVDPSFHKRKWGPPLVPRPQLRKAKRTPAEARVHMEAVLAEFFRQTAEHFEALVLHHADTEKALSAQRKPPGRLRKGSTRQEQAALLDALTVNWEGLAEVVEPDLETLAQAGVIQGLAPLHLSGDRELLSRSNRVASAWAADRAAELVGLRRLPDGSSVENPDARYSINEVTRDELRSIIADAFSSGATIEDLAREIRQSGAFTEARAALIANTEAARATSQGNLAGWRERGQLASVSIVLSADHSDGGCECDEAAEGSPYAIDDPSLPDLPIHPACRCSYVINALTGGEEDED